MCKECGGGCGGKNKSAAKQVDLITGEVIRARVKGAPFVFHYGVVVFLDGVMCIMHNPRGKEPIIESAEVFFANRCLSKSYGVIDGATNENLVEKHNQIYGRKYDLFGFNCEDYVNYIIDESKFKGGKMMVMALIGFAITLLCIAALKINK